MTDSRLDALRALLAIPCEDEYKRVLQYSLKQPDRSKLDIPAKSEEERIVLRWLRRIA